MILSEAMIYMKANPPTKMNIQDTRSHKKTFQNLAALFFTGIAA